MPSFVVDDYLVNLPPIGSFGRPAWAYDLLPDGWQVLERLVMGNSQLLAAAMTIHPDSKLDVQDAFELAVQSGACETIARLFATAAIYMTPLELASWYREWEARVFQKYREQKA